MISLKSSGGGGDRTPDLTGMNRTLSPAELHRQIFMVVRHKNYSTTRLPLCQHNFYDFLTYILRK